MEGATRRLWQVLGISFGVNSKRSPWPEKVITPILQKNISVLHPKAPVTIPDTQFQSVLLYRALYHISSVHVFFFLLLIATDLHHKETLTKGRVYGRGTLPCICHVGTFLGSWHPWDSDAHGEEWIHLVEPSSVSESYQRGSFFKAVWL